MGLNWVDLGDACIYCGRQTSPGMVTYFQRVPAATRVDEWSTWLAERFPAGTAVKGYACEKCLSDDLDESCSCKVCEGSCGGYWDNPELKLCELCEVGECIG